MSTEFERTQQAILLSNIGQNLQLWDVQSKLAGVRASSAATAQASRDAAWAAEKTQRIAAARERRELDAVAREERENELREIVFKAETNFRQIEKSLSLSPPTSFYWAKRTKSGLLDANEVSTASFRSFEDKERVQAAFETASRVIGVCEQRVSESDRRDVEKCLEYEAQIQPLEFLTNFTRENEARRAQLESELAAKTIELNTVQTQVEELQKSQTPTEQSNLGGVAEWAMLIMVVILFILTGATILNPDVKWLPYALIGGFVIFIFLLFGMGAKHAEAKEKSQVFSALKSQADNLDREMQSIRERLANGAADPVLATEAGRIYSLFPFLRDLSSDECARMLVARQEFVANARATFASCVETDESSGFSQAMLDMQALEKEAQESDAIPEGFVLAIVDGQAERFDGAQRFLASLKQNGFRGLKHFLQMGNSCFIKDASATIHLYSRSLPLKVNALHVVTIIETFGGNPQMRFAYAANSTHSPILKTLEQVIQDRCVVS